MNVAESIVNQFVLKIEWAQGNKRGSYRTFERLHSMAGWLVGCMPNNKFIYIFLSRPCFRFTQGSLSRKPFYQRWIENQHTKRYKNSSRWTQRRRKNISNVLIMNLNPLTLGQLNIKQSSASTVNVNWEKCFKNPFHHFRFILNDENMAWTSPRMKITFCIILTRLKCKLMRFSWFSLTVTFGH